MVTHFAVVPVKGDEELFVIFDADLAAGHSRHMSAVLTEPEVRGELRRRGSSAVEIDAIIAKARVDGPLEE